MTKRSSFTHPFLTLAATAAILFAIACNAPAPTPATNPDLAIAPTEYADLTKTALEHLLKFEFDAWGAMLADTIVYNFPDGDHNTRTKLVGKQVVLDWWKNWQKTSGIQSMTMERLVRLPVEVTKSNAEVPLKGVYVHTYFSNQMVYNNAASTVGSAVGVRMNFVVHFNQDKKIDRYFTYYDRTPIIEAMGGKNLLKSEPAAK